MNFSGQTPGHLYNFLEYTKEQQKLCVKTEGPTEMGCLGVPGRCDLPQNMSGMSVGLVLWEMEETISEKQLGSWLFDTPDIFVFLRGPEIAGFNPVFEVAPDSERNLALMR